MSVENETTEESLSPIETIHTGECFPCQVNPV